MNNKGFDPALVISQTMLTWVSLAQTYIMEKEYDKACKQLDYLKRSIQHMNTMKRIGRVENKNV